MSDYTFRGLILYFLRLGTTGFGGPAALVNYMERDLVENRGWITKDEFIEGLALAQLAPGPLAAQLAIYLGWVRGGVVGATLVGAVFIAPAFLMCLALALAYIHYGSLSWIQSLFYAVGACVIGIIANSAFKLARRTLGKDWLLIALFCISAILTAMTGTEIVMVIVGAGIVSLLVRAPPNFGSTANLFLFPTWLMIGITGPAKSETLWNLAVFFTKAGAVIFGSGLAIVPFLHSGVVEHFHWLNERQFIDAVAVAMITPGPVVITAAFIGFLVAGLSGAIVAATGTFLPCYLMVVLLAPYYKRLTKSPRIKAFVQGVTAAAIGAIAGATWILGRQAITDTPTIVIAVVTLALVVKTKIPEPIIILFAGIAGLVLNAKS